MLIDIFKNLIENTAKDILKGLDELTEQLKQENESAQLRQESGDEEIRRGLLKFKMDMLRHMPFYGDILMKVPMIEDKNISTACTNGKNIRYNPDFLRKLSEGERNYIFLHEVMHIMMMHWKRCGDRDPELWNIASDWMVNSKLDLLAYNFYRAKIPFKRPEKGCFLDIEIRSDYTEKLYDEMIDNNIKKTRDGKVFIHGKKMSLPIKDLTPPDKLSAGDEDMTEKQIKELVRETLKRRGNDGNLYLPREVTELVETKKLPWYRLLYDFLQQRDDEESSYLTPERKYIHMDLIVPGIGKVDDELGEIWAFVDSSGSINGNDLSQFLTQLYRISKEFECTFNIAFWDTAVTDVYRDIRRKEDILKCMAYHSGGTNINCVYRYISENSIKPEVMIILTDGYYGTLSSDNKKLRDKTILVISEGGASIEENNNVGRLARL